MSVLLFGRDGQLGSYLQTHLGSYGDLVSYDRELDLRDGVALRQAIARARPQLIINASAYTAVDLAETEAEDARLVNTEAPRIMAQAAATTGALLVHYSTDYVFDGAATTPYTEEAATRPLGVYGKTKAAGEEAVRANCRTHFIIRTAWLYSHSGKNFLKTVLRMASEQPKLRIVADRTGSPTCAADVGDATLKMLDALQRHPSEALFGTYHMTAQGQTSWHGFASKIVEYAAAQVTVEPIATSEYPTPARRPAYSVLDNSKLARAFGVALPHWEQGLRQCMMTHGLSKQL